MSFKNTAEWMILAAGILTGSLRADMPVVRTEEVLVESKNSPHLIARTRPSRSDKVNVSFFVHYEDGTLKVDIEPEKGYQIFAYCNEADMGLILPKDLEILEVVQTSTKNGKPLELSPSRTCRVVTGTLEGVLKKLVALKPEGNLAIQAGNELLDEANKELKDEERAKWARVNRLIDLKSPNNHLEWVTNDTPKNPFDALRESIHYEIKIGPQEGITPKPNPKLFALFNLQVWRGQEAKGEINYLLVPLKETPFDFKSYMFSTREIGEGTKLANDEEFKKMAKQHNVSENPFSVTAPEKLAAFHAKKVDGAEYVFGDNSRIILGRCIPEDEAEARREILERVKDLPGNIVIKKDGAYLISECREIGNEKDIALVKDMVEKWRRRVDGKVLFYSH